MNFRQVVTIVAAALPAVAAAQAQDRAGERFFEESVRPVLAANCYACHSRQSPQAQGGLRVDSPEAILAGGNAGPLLVPGKPERSLLTRVLSHEDEVKMPPTGKLADGDIAAVERWIRLGAPLPGEAVPSSAAAADRADGHWAFARPQRPAPPAKIGDWALTPIDRFIAAKLDAEGLAPSAEADRRTLIRRAYFDLLGLPPSPQEVRAFVADPSPGAYAALVDRLLASKHFGERWARYWLDVARYSDEGFQARPFPISWTYRDWVIDAFNDDMPYDRFVTRQLAADLTAGDRRASRRPGFIDRGHQPSPPHGRSGKPGRQNRRRDARVSGAVGGLRALPRSQIRPHSAEGLLFPLQHFSELAGRARADSDRRHARRRRGAVFQRKAENAPRVDRRIPPRAAGLAHRRVPQAGRAGTLHRRRMERAQPVEPPLGSSRQREQPEPSICWSAGASTFSTGKTRARLWSPAWMRRRGRKTSRRGWPRPTAMRPGPTPSANACGRPLRGDEAPTNVPLEDFWWIQNEGDSNVVKALKWQYYAVMTDWSFRGGPRHAMTVADAAERQPAYVFVRGNQHDKGAQVEPHFVSIVSDEPFRNGSGRLELARAIADADNPLTARVMVNRVWQHLFGEGTGAHAERFRQARRQPLAPRVARLPGGDFRRGRLVGEEADPAGDALARLPPAQRRCAGLRGGRSDKPAAVAAEPPPSRFRSSARFHAGGRGPSRRRRRRACRSPWRRGPRRRGARSTPTFRGKSRRG